MAAAAAQREEAVVAGDVSSPPPLRLEQKRTLFLAVDGSTISDRQLAWVAKKLLQPGDLVHLVMAVPPTQDPTITLGAWEAAAPECGPYAYAGIEAARDDSPARLPDLCADDACIR
eukprot:4372218-Pyramimonas_sp.AAC.2